VGTSSAAKAIDQQTAPDRSAARPTPRWTDLAAVALYLALAFWVTSGLWRHIGALALVSGGSDVRFFEWALIHATRIFAHGENPFFTPQMNAPNGVNLMANTGLLGLTVHLSHDGLRMIRPPGPGVVSRPANGIFHWPMYETTVYAGGALWLANQVGIVACLDPRTGRVVASERVPQSQLILELAVDQSRRTIIVGDGRGLAVITPPGRCWR